MKALEPQNLKKTILITGIIVMISIGLFAYYMFALIKENSSCMTNPLVYGLNHIASSDGKQVTAMCTCNLGTSAGGSTTFKVDKEKVYPEEKPAINNVAFQKVNFSNIILLPTTG